MMQKSIAMIAYGETINELINFASKHRAILSRYLIFSTGVTAQRLQTECDLTVEFLIPPEEADLQIAVKLIEKELAAVIFLVDPEESQVHQEDFFLLWETCNRQNIIFITNLATAELAIQALAQTRVGYLIFNPVAGQGNPDQELILIRRFLEPKIHIKTIYTKPDIDPAEQAKEIIALIQLNNAQNQDDPETDLIIASGGDGTVSAIASATISTGIPLGVIPRGTANAFSVALGIPTNIRGACETILAGNTRVIDAVRCNDLPMILLAGIGFEAEMVDRASRELKNRLGTLAYILAGAQQLAQQEVFAAQIEINDHLLELEAATITVANVAPATSVLAQGFGQVIPDDGLLEITIGSSTTLLQGINAIISLLASAIVKSPAVRDDIVCLRSDRLKITTDPPQKIVVDGEIIGTTPVEFKCLPQSLTVYVPLNV